MLHKVNLFARSSTRPIWKRQPSRPPVKWTDQLRRDNYNIPIMTLWRPAVGRGSLGTDATALDDYALKTIRYD